MSANVWLKRDIAAALTAAWQSQQEAALNLGGDGQRAMHYLAGFRAALVCVALFFQLSPGAVLPDMAPGPETFRQLEGRR